MFGQDYNWLDTPSKINVVTTKTSGFCNIDQDKVQELYFSYIHLEMVCFQMTYAKKSNIDLRVIKS